MQHACCEALSVVLFALPLFSFGFPPRTTGPARRSWDPAGSKGRKDDGRAKRRAASKESHDGGHGDPTAARKEPWGVIIVRGVSSRHGAIQVADQASSAKAASEPRAAQPADGRKIWKRRRLGLPPIEGPGGGESKSSP